jgi:hypothetical protein
VLQPAKPHAELTIEDHPQHNWLDHLGGPLADGNE